MSTPGPSHLLMLAGLGLATMVTASRYGFTIIKWAGVSYLVWVERAAGASLITAAMLLGLRANERT